MLQRLPPIGFWSYARQDEKSAGTNLRGLRLQLMAELQQQYGRDQVQIFQDVGAIPPGAEWEHEINNALNRSTFMITIITPAFVESEWCMREVAIFLKHEAEINARHPELGGRRRIFPIHYIDIDGVEPIDNEVYAALRKLQWTRFVDLRFDGERDKNLLLALAKVAGSIKQLLYVRVDIPTLAEQEDRELREEEAIAANAEREQQAAAAQAARDAEAGRRREEDFARERQRRGVVVAQEHDAELKLQQIEQRRGTSNQATKKRSKMIASIAAPTNAYWLIVAAAMIVIFFGLTRDGWLFDIGKTSLTNVATAIPASPRLKGSGRADNVAPNRTTGRATAGVKIESVKDAIPRTTGADLAGWWSLSGTNCGVIELNVRSSAQGKISLNNGRYQEVPLPDGAGWMAIDGAWWRLLDVVTLQVSATRHAKDATEFIRCK